MICLSHHWCALRSPRPVHSVSQEPTKQTDSVERVDDVKTPSNNPKSTPKKPFNMGLAVGSATINDTIYNSEEICVEGNINGKICILKTLE